MGKIDGKNFDMSLGRLPLFKSGTKSKRREGNVFINYGKYRGRRCLWAFIQFQNKKYATVMKFHFQIPLRGIKSMLQQIEKDGNIILYKKNCDVKTGGWKIERNSRFEKRLAEAKKAKSDVTE